MIVYHHPRPKQTRSHHQQAVRIDSSLLCSDSLISYSPPTSLNIYRKVVYKSRGLCAIFQLFGAASIQVRLLFEDTLHAKS